MANGNDQDQTFADFGDDFGDDFVGQKRDRPDAAGLNVPGDVLIGRYLGYRLVQSRKRDEPQQLHRFADVKIRWTDDGKRRDQAANTLEVWGAANMNAGLEQCEIGGRVLVRRTDEIQQAGRGKMVMYEVVEAPGRPNTANAIGRPEKLPF